MLKLLRELFCIILILLGGISQYYLLSKGIKNSYSFLYISSLIQIIFFGGFLLYLKYIKKVYIRFNKYPLVYLSIGLLSTLYNIIYTYHNHKNPLIDINISYSNIIITIGFTLLIIHSKKYINFINRYTSISFIILCISFAYSFLLLYLNVNSIYIKNIVWIILIIIGNLFNAMINILQEYYIEQLYYDYHIVSDWKHIMNYITVLFYSSVFQFITIVVIFPIDFIPIFGNSTTIYHLLKNITDFSQITIIIAMTICSITFSIGNIGLNINSAIFNSMINSLIIPITTIIYSQESYKLLYYMPIIVLNILSAILWKCWEFTDNKFIFRRSVLVISS